MTLPERYDADEEARLIKAVEGWPYRPVLPVKKVGGDREFGIVVAGRLSTVVLMSLFELTTGPVGPQIEGRKSIEFDSVEAMVAAGWIGD